MTRRSRCALAAVALLATAAFGGLSVGVPLVYASRSYDDSSSRSAGQPEGDGLTSP